MTRQSSTSTPARGRFVTFEGGEGTGKTTQIKLLAELLEARGQDVVQTREPGGSPGAEAIRELLVTGETGRWEPSTEAQLHYAARNEHLHRVIRPALERGAIVLCDRFSDSTMAYQGIVQGLGADTVNALDDLVVGETRPDLTLIFDLDSKTGLERASSRAGDEDRYERMGADFHQRLRDAFLKIAGDNPGRCVIVDASGSVPEVSETILRIVDQKLDLT
jgi:dTMP kinase